LSSQLHTILALLRTNFSTHPPHTIQRLSELILQPTRHYTRLEPYLRALDRVVNVSSGADKFPLPVAAISTDATGVLRNGTAGSAATALGSDESLGGALLTPIPWLREGGGGDGMDTETQPRVRTESTQTIEGPRGAGSVETVTVALNGVASTKASGPETTQDRQLQSGGSDVRSEVLD